MKRVEHPPFEDKGFVSLFSKLRLALAEKMARKIVNLAPIKNGETLLDLGCGPGLVTRSIMSVRVLSKALLVDRSREMVRTAQKNLASLTSKSYFVRKVDLEVDDLRRCLDCSCMFDQVIAVDLWHLLENRDRISRFLFDRALVPGGKFTLTLHKEISKGSMERWHSARRQIREEITASLKDAYPGFELVQRSKGATVHRGEMGSFVKELKEVGFKLASTSYDKQLADVNQMSRHLPEVFKLEVRRKLPEIEAGLLNQVVDSSVRRVLKTKGRLAFEPIATEAFLVFHKPK